MEIDIKRLNEQKVKYISYYILNNINKNIINI